MPEARKTPVPVGLALGAVVLALCCGGPLLIAALATTAIGAAVTASGWIAAGLGVVALGLAAGGYWWLRRRAAAACDSDRPAEVRSRD